MTNQELGEFGEDYALNYLLQKGFRLIEKNYRFKRNEVDLICKDKDKFVFVEVKTRKTAEIGEPWKAVTKSKQKQIIKCANQFLIENNIEQESRFDIVSIVHNSYGTRLEHIDDAFYPIV